MDPGFNQTALRRIFTAAANFPLEGNSSLRALARLVISYTGGFDKMVKTMVLEGVAGVPPMSWAGRGRPEKEIEKHLGPEAASLLDAGINVYTEVKRRIERFLPANAPLTAEDLLQQAIMGLNINNKPTREYLFYSVGKNLSPDRARKVQYGNLNWKQDVANHAIAYMKNRVRDVMKMMRKEREKGDRSAPLYHRHRNDDDYSERELPSFSDLSTDSQMGLALRLLSERSNTRFRKIQDWMARMVREKARDSDQRIFEALIENIEQGSPKNESAIARELGISSAAVTQAKKRLGKLLASELQKNEKILDPIWESLEIEQLGYGVSPLGRRARLNPDRLVFQHLCAAVSTEHFDRSIDICSRSS